MRTVDKKIVIIGAGPAGLAAACALYKLGERDILLLEREKKPGGILRQCIHDGFGLTRFQESLSGPEYAARFIREAEEYGIEIETGTTVVELGKDRTVTAVSASGMTKYRAGAAGVWTAGVAQTYINLKNIMVGQEVVILGSGDIGMIMARRLTLEGAHVKGVYEILPYASGLPRNVEQCLNDYGIPLHLQHTVTEIHGKDRLEAVTVSRVDEQRNPIPGTEEKISCDTLILSVGLIPENELTRMADAPIDPGTQGAVVDENFQTGTPGIFAAGNVLHVHDLVDFVSLEAEQLAASVTEYLKDGLPECDIPVTAEGAVQLIPQRISGMRAVTFALRPKEPGRKVKLRVVQDGKVLAEKTVPRALPAEMVHIAVDKDAWAGSGPVKVVMSDD